MEEIPDPVILESQVNDDEKYEEERVDALGDVKEGVFEGKQDAFASPEFD